MCVCVSVYVAFLFVYVCIYIHPPPFALLPTRSRKGRCLSPGKESVVLGYMNGKGSLSDEIERRGGSGRVASE